MQILCIEKKSPDSGPEYHFHNDGTHIQNGSGTSGDSCNGTTSDDTQRMNLNFKNRISQISNGKVLHVVANAQRSSAYTHEFTMQIFPFGEPANFVSVMWHSKDNWAEFKACSHYRDATTGVTDWRWEKNNPYKIEPRQ